MVNNDPPDPRSRASDEPLPYEALRRLEERLERVSDAAERLISQAADPSQAGNPSRAGDPSRAAEPPQAGNPSPAADPAAPRPTRKPPPAGWQPPEADGASGDARGAGELELLLGALQVLRELMPPDLQQRLAEALREVLLALRALIDWYLERAGHRRGGSDEVQDIPIL